MELENNEKSYAVIVNAKRAILESVNPRYVKVGSADYHTGTIALIHPDVLNYVNSERDKKVEAKKKHLIEINNLPEVITDGRNVLNRSQAKAFHDKMDNMYPMGLSNPQMVFSNVGFDIRDEKGVVLLAPYHIKEHFPYILLGVYEGEFVKLNSTTIDDLTKEVNEVFQENNINYGDVSKHVVKSWEALETFDIMRNNNIEDYKIKEIPFEDSARHLDDSVADARNEYLKNIW